MKSTLTGSIAPPGNWLNRSKPVLLGVLAMLLVGGAAAADTGATVSDVGHIGTAAAQAVTDRLVFFRDRLEALVGGARAAVAASADLIQIDGVAGLLRTLVPVLLLLGGGVLAELAFRLSARRWVAAIVNRDLSTPRDRCAAQLRRILFSEGLVLSFALGAALAFILAAGLLNAGVVFVHIALVVVGARAIHAAVRFVLSPWGPRFRLVALSSRTAVTCYRSIVTGTVCCAATIVGAAVLSARNPLTANDALSDLTLLLAALEVPAILGVTLLSMPVGARRPTFAGVAVALAPITSWILLQADLPEAARIILVLGVAPITSLMIGEVTRTLAFGPHRRGLLPQHARTVSRLARDAGALVALGLLAILSMNSSARSHAPIAIALLTTLEVVLGADLVWQLSKEIIDRSMAPRDGNGRGADRLRTLLPALRTAVFLSILVTVGLSAASAFGLEIGPLLAGAGVVGLSVGIGAQSLVRDVIAGFFFLLDDAFRVGEIIASGSLQGEVEAFTLRSVRLRDENGHIHTVAFGELKAVTNFSRDWAGMEVPLYVRLGVPFASVAAVIEDAISELAANQDLASFLYAETRFLGVTAVSDVTMKFVVLVRTLPGRQFAVRAELLRLILDGMARAGLPVGLAPPASRDCWREAADPVPDGEAMR